MPRRADQSAPRLPSGRRQQKPGSLAECAAARPESAASPVAAGVSAGPTPDSGSRRGRDRHHPAAAGVSAGPASRRSPPRDSYHTKRSAWTTRSSSKKRPLRSPWQEQAAADSSRQPRPAATPVRRRRKAPATGRPPDVARRARSDPVRRRRKAPATGRPPDVARRARSDPGQAAPESACARLRGRPQRAVLMVRSRPRNRTLVRLISSRCFR